MNTLKKGKLNNSTMVKFMQSALHLHGYDIGKDGIDGKFGKCTDTALRAFQSDHKLVIDGSCGNKTWLELGFTGNNNILVWRIPFSNIIEPEINLANCKETQKMINHYSQTKKNIIVNLGMFDMKTFRNCQDLIIDGKVDNGGNYSDKGIAIRKHSKECPLMYQSTTSASKGTSVDFVGGSPSMIYNGRRCVESKVNLDGVINKKTIRTCIGIDNNNLYLFFGLKPVILNDVLEIGSNLKLTTMINADGGGSCGLVVAGYHVIKTTRTIPSTLCFNVRW